MGYDSFLHSKIVAQVIFIVMLSEAKYPYRLEKWILTSTGSVTITSLRNDKFELLVNNAGYD